MLLKQLHHHAHGNYNDSLARPVGGGGGGWRTPTRQRLEAASRPTLTRRRTSRHRRRHTVHRRVTSRAHLTPRAASAPVTHTSHSTQETSRARRMNGGELVHRQRVQQASVQVLLLTDSEGAGVQAFCFFFAHKPGLLLTTTYVRAALKFSRTNIFTF